MKVRRFAMGPMFVLGLLAAQCGGEDTTTPRRMPENAPASVRSANNCVGWRMYSTFQLVGHGQGWWVVDQHGAVYGWVEIQDSGCPNDVLLEGGAVYASGR